jgi:hypothetical protein
MNAQEHYKTENEMVEELTESYGVIKIAHLEIDAGSLLRDYDVPFFDECIAESMRWRCDICWETYEEEDSAEECCKESCNECGELLDSDSPGLCDGCQWEEEGEE